MLVHIVGVLIGLFCIAMNGLAIYHDIKWPPASKLKHSNGMIHHPTLGDYPEKVPYRKGMTLHPGQKTEIIIVHPHHENSPESL